ncbi:hypothetical protein OROMI_032877 [Orobanche minor]
MAISSSTTVAVMTVALLLAASGLVESQSTCASKLIPCAEYLNSTKPSSACCGAMKTVVTDTDQLSCLCRLLRSPDALNGINLTQALELPKYCNLTSDTSACNGAQAPPGSSSLPPPVRRPVATPRILRV